MEILSQIPMNVILIGILIILGGRWISNKAYSTPARLFWFVLGMIFVNSKVNLEPFEIYLAVDLFLGIGFMIPHIKYFIDYILDFIKTTIAVTYNLYTLWLTIYYKIRKVFLWIYSFFDKADKERQKRRYEKESEEFYRKKQQEQNKQEEQNSYYEKQEYKNYYQEDEQTNSYNEKEEYNNSYNESNSYANSN